MKRAYQSPTTEIINIQASTLMAGSPASLGMYEEADMGASEAYTQKKSAWDSDNWND